MSEEDTGQIDTTTSEQTDNVGSDDSQTLLGGDAEQGDGEQQAAGEQATADGSEGDGEQAPVVPDEYAFNVPEGMEMDQGFAEAISPIFKELNLTQEQADALTTAYAENIQASQQAQADAFQKQLSDWADELRKDPELGGDGFEQRMNDAQTWIDQINPDMAADFKAFLHETGAGSHPAVVKWIHAMSQKFPVKEDQPGSGLGAANADIPDYAKMYPGMMASN